MNAVAQHTPAPQHPQRCGAATGADFPSAPSPPHLRDSQAVVERKVEDLPDALKSSPLIVADRKTTSVVYRVVDDKAVATVVQTGPSNLTGTIIQDGVKVGEMIVSGPYKALERLKDGDAVKKEDQEWGGDGKPGSSGGGMGGGRGRGRRGF